MANIIADPTTAGKTFEFVGYVAKILMMMMCQEHDVYLSLPPSLSLSPPLSFWQTEGLPTARVGAVHVPGDVQEM